MTCFLVKILTYLFDAIRSEQSEISITIKDILKCQKCLNGESVCLSHSESLKSSILVDVQNWINDIKIIQQKENEN